MQPASPSENTGIQAGIHGLGYQQHPASRPEKSAQGKVHKTSVHFLVCALFQASERRK